MNVNTIELPENHKLPSSYVYQLPVMTEPTLIKEDWEIINELKGSMPLSVIAKICDDNKRLAPNTKSKYVCDLIIYMDKNSIGIEIKPSPFSNKNESISMALDVDEFLPKKYREELVRHHLNNIIYGKR